VNRNVTETIADCAFALCTAPSLRWRIVAPMPEKSRRVGSRPTKRSAAAPRRTSESSAALKALRDDVVAANRILAHYGVLDAYGHVSARHPAAPDRFLISRSRAPELVTAADLMVLDLDCNPVDEDARQPYLERFIHGEIYRTRPDVAAIVHSHAPAVIPFAASSVALRPIYHMAAFLGRGAPVFDIRSRFGPTDLLVRNHDHGRALAESLGEFDVALMRGHGYVAVAPSVPLAVFRAVYTQLNAQLQQQAIALGGSVTYLVPEEAVLAIPTHAATIMRPWELWKRTVGTKK
jgi:ribulose-5-phosphate 4-epimerase/fuculose-1-phosphate aldolase